MRRRSGNDDEGIARQKRSETWNNVKDVAQSNPKIPPATEDSTKKDTIPPTTEVPPPVRSPANSSGNNGLDEEEERMRKLLDVFPSGEDDSSSSDVPLDEDEEDELSHRVLSPLTGGFSAVEGGVDFSGSADDLPSTVRHRRQQLRGERLPPLAYNQLTPPSAAAAAAAGMSNSNSTDGSALGTPSGGSGTFSPDMYTSPTSYRGSHYEIGTYVDLHQSSNGGVAYPPRRVYYPGRYGGYTSSARYSSPIADGSRMMEWGGGGSPSSHQVGDFSSLTPQYVGAGVPPSPSAMSAVGGDADMIPTLKEGQPHRCASENRMLRQILVATSTFLWVPYVVAALYVAYCDSFTVAGDDGRFPRPRRDYPAIYYLVFRDGFDVLQFMWRAMPIGFFSLLAVSVTMWLCQMRAEHIPVYFVAFAWFVGVSSFYFWGTDEVHHNKTESFLTSRSSAFPLSVGGLSSKSNNYTMSSGGVSALNSTSTMMSSSSLSSGSQAPYMSGGGAAKSSSSGWWSSIPPLPSPFMRNRHTTKSLLPGNERNQSASSAPSFSSSPASAAAAAAAAARSGLASWDEAFFSLLLQHGLVRVQDDLPTPSPWMWMWVSVSTGLLSGVLCKVYDRLQRKRQRMKRWNRGYYQGRRGSATRSPAPCYSPDAAAAAAGTGADKTEEMNQQPSAKEAGNLVGSNSPRTSRKKPTNNPNTDASSKEVLLGEGETRSVSGEEMLQKVASKELYIGGTPSVSTEFVHPDKTNTSTPRSRGCFMTAAAVGGGECTPPVERGALPPGLIKGIQRVGSTAQVSGVSGGGGGGGGMVRGASNTSFSSAGYSHRLSPRPPIVGGVGGDMVNASPHMSPSSPPAPFAAFKRRERIVIRPRMKRVTQTSRAMSLHMSLVIPFCTGQWFSLMMRYGVRGFLIQNLVVTVTLGFIGYSSICFQLIRKHLKRSSRELFESGTVMLRHRTLPDGTQVAEEDEIVVEMVEHQVDYMLFFYRLFATKMGLFVVMMICLHVYVTSWMITMIQTLYTLNALVSGAGILVELLIYEVV